MSHLKDALTREIGLGRTIVSSLDIPYEATDGTLNLKEKLTVTLYDNGTISLGTESNYSSHNLGDDSVKREVTLYTLQKITAQELVEALQALLTAGQNTLSYGFRDALLRASEEDKVKGLLDVVRDELPGRSGRGSQPFGGCILHSGEISDKVKHG